MKMVLITGATGNTGLGIAKKFASEGWGVVITGQREEHLPDAVNEIKHINSECEVIAYPLELIDGGAVNQKAIDFIFSDIDRRGIVLNALVLNAANLGIGQKIFENALSDFSEVINTNVVANYYLAESAACRMKEKHDGSIIFINSNTAYRAIPDRIAYSTSKAAQLGMMRAMALDLGKYNIRVNAVLPGMIKTDRWDNNYNNCRSAPSAYTPLGDIAEFSDIADAVWYFAAHARNTTGAELPVDGGNMIQLYPIIPQN